MESHYIEYGGRMERIYRNLYNKITPGCSVEIEFEHGDVSIFHYSNGSGEIESNWNPSEEKIDSLLIQSGLDRNSLTWLEKELDEIGCISISLKAMPHFVSDSVVSVWASMTIRYIIYRSHRMNKRKSMNLKPQLFTLLS